MKKEVFAAFRFRVKVRKEEARKTYEVMKRYRENIKKIKVLVKLLTKQGHSEEEALRIAVQRYKMKNLIIRNREKLVEAYIKSKCYRADSLILFNRYGYKYTCYIGLKENKVFLRIGGEINTWLPIKRSIFKAVKKREEWGWKPVFVILKFLCFTRKNGLFEVTLIFKVSSKKISLSGVKSALNENKLSVISVDLNAVHGTYFGVFRVKDNELKEVKVMKVNVDWCLLERHVERRAELQGKLREKGLSSREFRELRQLERRISNLVQYPKRRGLSILRELIRGEQSLGRVVVVVLENISEKDVQKMCNHGSEINRTIKWFMSGWQKRVKFLARIEGVFFMIVNKEYSSKKCPVCGKVMKYIDNRWLYCSQCGKSYHRDLVALRNLAIRALEKIKKHNTSLP
ncbi:MAG: hypothetical protein DRJ52_10630 [Thermoprotei archaeon]|nr:MAG: hypothetical protein DRJ52_10630 [Thermoprotei archaeon]